MGHETASGSSISHSSSRFHALGWTLALLFAVPVLYLLSVPPLACYLQYPAGRSSQHSEALEVYYKPADWLWLHAPPAREPMNSYASWWQDVAYGPAPRDPFRHSYR